MILDIFIRTYHDGEDHYFMSVSEEPNLLFHVIEISKEVFNQLKLEGVMQI